MTSKIGKMLGFAVIFAAFGAVSAQAASIKNSDSEDRTLIVTEDGVKNEVIITVGETISVCDAGCFVTMPNGDRAALSGEEQVEIIDGGAVIK